MLSLAGDHNVLALNVDGEFLQRARRRSADVAAFQIVSTVVASAPDLPSVVAVLHGAVQVSADRREGLVPALPRANQDAGFGTELENLAGVRFQLAGLRRYHRAAGGFGDRRRDDVTERRIKKGPNRREHSAS